MTTLDGTMGVILIGTFVTLILYGSTVENTMLYLQQNSDDRLFLKTFVAIVIALDTFHSATLIHSCYHYLVSNYFGDFEAMDSIVWSLRIICLTTFGVIILVQAFYIRRIYIFKAFILPVVAIGVLLLIELSMIIVDLGLSLDIITFTGWARVSGVDSALFGSMLISDIALTLALVVLLRRSRGSFNRTNIALNTLVKYALFASICVSLLAVPALIVSLAQSQLLIHVALVLPAPKIYTNSLLVFLNSRKPLAQLANGSNQCTTLQGMSIFQRMDCENAACAADTDAQKPPSSPASIEPLATTMTEKRDNVQSHG